MKKKQPSSGKWYILHCQECKLDFEPVGSDNDWELLSPDYDRVAREAGYNQARQTRAPGSTSATPDTD